MLTIRINIFKININNADTFTLEYPIEFLILNQIFFFRSQVYSCVNFSEWHPGLEYLW